MARILRIGGSFAIVLVSYWAYALVAVPLIEPPADPHGSDSGSAAGPWSQGTFQRWREELEGLFPPGRWELENPKILESDQVKLLLQDYRIIGDGRKVKIFPCTVIFTPDGATAPAEQRKRRAVILEAPQGALLQFDQPFDPARGKVGRLESGKLEGRITIRSDGKSPGPEDDLMVVTNDVELDEERIWTPHAVDFQLGPNYGRGSDMRIKLLRRDEDEGNNRRGPSIAGVESFEIRRLERLHLHSGDSGLVPGTAAQATGRPGAVKPDFETGLPIEITCRGPFRFDPVAQVATFEQQVDVLRIHPNGPSDQLNCEELSVYFAKPRKTATPQAEREENETESEPLGEWKLQPRRIEARGAPVIVRAPSRQVHVQGERLELDLYSGRIVLDGSQPVFLRQAGREIHASKVQYQAEESGRLGQVAAEGPGWLRGQMAGKLGQTLEVRWNDRLQVRPHEGQKVISVTGKVELSFAGIGRLNAAEIYLWLFELPPAGPRSQPRFQPDRMLARGEVRLNAPQLSGAVRQLEVWFEGVPPSEDAGRGADEQTAGKDSAAVRQGVGLPAPGPAGETVRSEGGGQSLLSNAVKLPKHHFEIVGDLLRARLLFGGEDPELTELMVEGNVSLRETWSAEPDQAPLEVLGELIHVVDASEPHAALTITGGPDRPAHFEGRGIELTGPNINLNRGTNRLWIDGPGRMDLPDLPLERDLEGRPLADPGHLQVDWQQRMTFDGRTVRFEDSVLASFRHPGMVTNVQTEVMEADLLERIPFDDPENRSGRPQIERIVCRGPVLMESQSFDDRAQSSVDRMRLADLDVNLISGQTAAGPGWITSIRHGSSDLLPSDADPSPSADAIEPRAPEDDGLRYLSVGFQGSVDGNLHERKLTFRDQVEAVYGPVDSWESSLNPDEPQGLGPKGILLECDELTVVQMPLPAGDGRSVEFEAHGNVMVESRTYTARATDMTYAEAKDMLVLEGTGWSYAKLYRQERVGAEPEETVARKILFWPSTKRLSVIDPRSLKLPQLPGD